MVHSQVELEELWDALLSRQVEQIFKAFNSLDKEEKEAVITHLRKMSAEIGWHPEQAASAKSALIAIEGTA
jgi:hypothetical protein